MADFPQADFLQSVRRVKKIIKWLLFLPDGPTAEKPLVKNLPFKESTDHGLVEWPLSEECWILSACSTYQHIGKQYEYILSDNNIITLYQWLYPL